MALPDAFSDFISFIGEGVLTDDDQTRRAESELRELSELHAMKPSELGLLSVLGAAIAVASFLGVMVVLPMLATVALVAVIDAGFGGALGVAAFLVTGLLAVPLLKLRSFTKGVAIRAFVRRARKRGRALLDSASATAPVAVPAALSTDQRRRHADIG